MQNTLAAIKVFGLMAFAIAGLTWGQAPPEVAAAPVAVGGGVTVSGWLLALVPVMFSYSGWNAAAYVSEEIREPSKRLPRALALGTAIVVVVYLAMNAVYLYALPMERLTNLELRVIDAAAEQLFAGAAANALMLLSMLITAGTISAMVFAGPRVYYAMARDGLFMPAAAQVHPRWRTPVAAILAQGLWSADPGAVGDVLAAGQLHRLCDRALRRHRRGRAVRVAVARTRRRAAVPGLGLPAGAGALHRS